MGEIAEMVLEGTLCERCGVFIDDSMPGFPRLCPHCAQLQWEEEQEDIPYDYKFNKYAIRKLCEQVMEQGNPKQKKALIGMLYGIINKLKKGE